MSKLALADPPPYGDIHIWRRVMSEHRVVNCAHRGCSSNKLDDGCSAMNMILCIISPATCGGDGGSECRKPGTEQVSYTWTVLGSNTDISTANHKQHKSRCLFVASRYNRASGIAKGRITRSGRSKPANPHPAGTWWCSPQQAACGTH
jgi:hypothetical protein